MGRTRTIRTALLLSFCVGALVAQPADAKRYRYRPHNNTPIANNHIPGQPGRPPEPDNKHVNHWARDDLPSKSIWPSATTMWWIGGIAALLLAMWLGLKVLVARAQANPDPVGPEYSRRRA